MDLAGLKTEFVGQVGHRFFAADVATDDLRAFCDAEKCRRDCLLELTSDRVCFESDGNGVSHSLLYATHIQNRGNCRGGKPREGSAPAEKVAILRRHLIDRVPVSDLCDEYHLQPTIFYAWQKQFFEDGSAALERKNHNAHSEDQRTIAAVRAEAPARRRSRRGTDGGTRPAKKELGEL